MHRATGGDLFSYVHKRGRLANREAKLLFRQIGMAVAVRTRPRIPAHPGARRLTLVFDGEHGRRCDTRSTCTAFALSIATSR